MILDERTLPILLQEDLNEYKKNLEEFKKDPKNQDKDLEFRDSWANLYGTINSLQHGYEISKEVADYLREKYLFLKV